MSDFRPLPRSLRGPGYIAAAALVAVAVLSAAAPNTVARSTHLSVAPLSESPVADAAMRGDSAKLRVLLKQGADANAAQADGLTALHWAAARGEAALVRMLVFAGARLETTTRNGSFTPLHLAAQAGRGTAVRALLEAGANANAVTSSGGAAPLHLAAQQGNVEAVNALLEFKAKVDATEAAYAQTPLMWAATYDRVGAIQALIAKGANIEAVSKVENMSDREKADRASNALRNRKVAALKSAENPQALPAAGTPRAPGAPGSAPAGAPPGTPAGAPPGAPPAGAGTGAFVPAPGSAAPGTAAPSLAAPATASASGSAAPATKVAAIEPAKDARKADKPNEKKNEDKAGKPDAKNADAPKSISVPRGDVALKTAADSALAANAPRPLNAAPDTSARSAAGGAQPQPAQAAGGGRGAGQSYGDLIGNKGGLTPLLFAVRQGNMDAMRALLKAGAKVNQVSGGDHTSPLLMATINGQFDLAKVLLLEAKADPKLASDAGATPLYTAINVQWAAKSLYPQPTAQYQQQTGYLELMELLIKSGADVNARLSKHLWYMSYNFDLLGVNTTGATPFWRAAYGTDVEAMKLLVKYGADITTATKKPAGVQRDQDGNVVEEGAVGPADPSGLPQVPAGGPGVFPLHAASGVGYGEGFAANAHRHAPDAWVSSVKYLIEDLKQDVNARDYKGYSALHHAAARGDTVLAAYLMARGGDIKAVSRSGQTVADMANGPVQRVPPFYEAVVWFEKAGSKNSNKCKSC